MYYKPVSGSGAVIGLSVSFFPYRNAPDLISPKLNSGDVFGHFPAYRKQ